MHPSESVMEANERAGVDYDAAGDCLAAALALMEEAKGSLRPESLAADYLSDAVRHARYALQVVDQYADG